MKAHLFWFKTDLNAPRGRVIAIDIHNPLSSSIQNNWQEIIPEAAETLEGVGILNNQFVAAYLKDAHSQIKIFNLDGLCARNSITRNWFGGRIWR